MNDSDPINTALGNLWASFLQSLNVDLANHQMILRLAFYKNGKIARQHKVEFEGVSAFFFVNGQGKARFKTSKSRNIELSEAYYFSSARDHLSHRNDKVGTPQYEANPNFHLELWDTALLIEAKAMIVDGIRYEAHQ